MNKKRTLRTLFFLKFAVIGLLAFSLRYEFRVETEALEQTGIFTAYTATAAETDSTPTITASNQKVRDGIAANNCLPFGTKIRVNDRIFEIQDRMNRRYGCENFDIYMWEYSEAIVFGRQKLKYEII